MMIMNLWSGNRGDYQIPLIPPGRGLDMGV